MCCARQQQLCMQNRKRTGHPRVRPARRGYSAAQQFAGAAHMRVTEHTRMCIWALQLTVYMLAYVSRRFSEAVCSVYQEGDVVWVQDYHLMLLPAMLKKQHPKMKVCLCYRAQSVQQQSYRSPSGKLLKVGLRCNRYITTCSNHESVHLALRGHYEGGGGSGLGLCKSLA